MGDVVNFWKPYRARLVPLEMIEFRSRLGETIIVEDEGPGTSVTDVLQDVHDFYSGMSCGEPCCPPGSDTTSVCSFNPREFYDCGSWHDIGSVSDFCKELQIDIADDYHDTLNCIPADLDSTAIVTSMVISDSTNFYFIDTPSGDSLVEPTVYYQSGGFSDFDAGGTFDCTHGFDLINIEVIDTIGQYILQEDSGKLQLEHEFGALELEY